jgi:hypothetical protein
MWARARADAAAAGAVGVLCRLVAGVLKQAGRGDAAAVSMLVTTDFRSKPSLVGALESLASLTGQQDSCGASCAAAAAAEGAVAMSLGVRRFERVYGDIFFYTAVLLAAVVKNDPRGVARAGAREAGAFALLARAIMARQDDPNMAGALCHALSAVIGTCPEHLAGLDMAQASCAIPALVRLLGCDEWEARATASTVLMRVTCGPPRSPASANAARAHGLGALECALKMMSAPMMNEVCAAGDLLHSLLSLDESNYARLLRAGGVRDMTTLLHSPSGPKMAWGSLLLAECARRDPAGVRAALQGGGGAGAARVRVT